MRIRLPLPSIYSAIVALLILGTPLSAPSFAAQNDASTGNGSVAAKGGKRLLNLGAPSFAPNNPVNTEKESHGAKGGQSLLDTFLRDFDLPAAAALADARLKQ